MIHIGIIGTRTSTSTSFRLGKTGEGVEKVGVDKLVQNNGSKKEKRKQHAKKLEDMKGDSRTRYGMNKGGNDQGHSQSQGGTRYSSESGKKVKKRKANAMKN